MRLLIFCIFFTFSIFGQDKLYLKDGNTIKGSIVYILEDFVKMRNDSSGKVKKFDKKNIDRLVEKAEYFDNDDDYINGVFNIFNIYEKAILNLDSLEYKIRKISWRKQRSPVVIKDEWLVAKLISGKVSLYVGHKKIDGFRVTQYFLHRDGEEEMKNIILNEAMFKKRIAKYFSDCKKLSGKIENKQYKYNDIFKIIESYNTNTCEL